MDVPYGFRLGLVSHFYSPLALATVAPNFGNPGEIFRTDFTGDGTVQDPLPGTKFGTFERGVNASGLAGLINGYNNNVAVPPLLRARLLVSNGLMTLQQLQSLGGVAPTLCPPPPTSAAGCANSAGSQVDFGWLRALVLRLAWRHTFKERFSIEPSVGFYNLFNFSNFNLPPNTMNGLLLGSGNGSINGTTRSEMRRSVLATARVFTRSVRNGKSSSA